MSQENFDRFGDLVLQDAALQDQLKDITDYQLFTETVVRLGNEQGYRFTTLEVESAINSRRRAWFERWITR
jgi:Nitrogen fixation protein of unknown function.